MNKVHNDIWNVLGLHHQGHVTILCSSSPPKTLFPLCCIRVLRRGIYNKCVCDSDLQRDRTGYTDLEQKLPAAIYITGLVIVVVAGLLGLQGNRNVTSGLDLMFTGEKACHG